MVHDAKLNAAEDQKFEDLIKARNLGDGMIHSSKKMLDEVGDKASSEEKLAVQSAIDELENALKDGNREVIDLKTASLAEVSGVLAKKMYTEDQQQGHKKESNSKSSDDSEDAVDAEFEEVSEADKK